MTAAPGGHGPAPQPPGNDTRATCGSTFCLSPPALAAETCYPCVRVIPPAAASTVPLHVRVAGSCSSLAGGLPSQMPTAGRLQIRSRYVAAGLRAQQKGGACHLCWMSCPLHRATAGFDLCSTRQISRPMLRLPPVTSARLPTIESRRWLSTTAHCSVMPEASAAIEILACRLTLSSAWPGGPRFDTNNRITYPPNGHCPIVTGPFSLAHPHWPILTAARSMLSVGPAGDPGFTPQS